MKRNIPISIDSYLDARISQLREDVSKASDAYDVLWYNRLIQELLWIKQVIEGKEK
jgi:hypothetical protein